MRVPRFPTLKYVSSTKTKSRRTYYYTCDEILTECYRCGHDKLHGGGTRKSVIRHDVESTKDGRLPVYLEISRKAFNCPKCGSKLSPDAPVPLATSQTSMHFANMVRASALSSYQASRQFLVQRTRVDLLRASSIGVERRSGLDPRMVAKAKAKESAPPSSTRLVISNGAYTAAYAFIHARGAAPLKSVIDHLKALGMVGIQRVMGNLANDHIATVHGRKIRLNDFILPSHLQWPATGPAPKTMLGKHRAEQPAIRRELMGYSMEVAA